jgi:hypothetical protein
MNHTKRVAMMALLLMGAAVSLSATYGEATANTHAQDAHVAAMSNGLHIDELYECSLILDSPADDGRRGFIFQLRF